MIDEKQVQHQIHALNTVVILYSWSEINILVFNGKIFYTASVLKFKLIKIK